MLLNNVRPDKNDTLIFSIPFCRAVVAVIFVSDFFRSRFSIIWKVFDGEPIFINVRGLYPNCGRGFFECVDKGLSHIQGKRADRVGLHEYLLHVCPV